MTSVTTDRRQGLVGSTAFKPPCDVATTVNITLSGEQAIDGVTTSASRVLVKNQTDSTQNGIYDTGTGAWSRAVDSNGNYDFKKGTQVYVTGGSTQANTPWALTSSNPVTIGTSAITWTASTAVGSLATQLASTVSAVLGAALVGFGPGLGYATGTVGARVNKTGHVAGTNVIIGFGAADDHLLTGTVGYRSTIVGVGAGAAIGSAVTAGGSNSYFGYGAGAANTEGSGNCFYGALCATANTTGDHSNAFGYRALDKATTSTQNNAFGFETLFNITSASNNNCAFGESALFTMTSGNGNVAVGMNCLYSRTTGDYSVAMGFQAAFGQTSAAGNTAIGKEALYNYTTQGLTTAVGYEAGRGVAGGQACTWIGYQAGTAVNGGSFNTGVGYFALVRMTTGSSNTAIGQQAGSFVTTGGENVCVGNSAGFGVATTSSNVAVGSSTLNNLDGGFNTAVGYNAGSPVAAQTWTNTTALGNGALPTGSNQITLGNASIATIRAQVTTITALSDQRDKKDIQSLADLIPTDFVNDIQFVGFRWAMRDGTDRGQALQAGVIAQQLKAAQEKHGVEWLRLVDESDPDRIEATPGNLMIPFMLKTQQLVYSVRNLEQRVTALESGHPTAT